MDYKFTNLREEDLLEHLYDCIPKEMEVPGEGNTVRFTHNGDDMAIELDTGIVHWEPLKPGDISSSKLSMRLHQWFGKGLIRPLEGGGDRA